MDDRSTTTIFTAPKPFQGHIDLIQRNAIRSWTLLRPRPQILLLGDETGTVEVADELGVVCIPQVCRNEWGTPLLDDVFRKARQKATGSVLAYANADVILLENFSAAIPRILSGGHPRFLVIGRRIDIDINERIDFDACDWQPRLRERLIRAGRFASRVAKDYFIFDRDSYIDIPPFAVGRGNWDNWIVYHAHRLRIPVIDENGQITAIHQNHDYSHLSGGRASGYVTGPEAKRNQELAGGRHLVRGSASTWKLTPRGVRRRLIRFSFVQFVADLPLFGLLLIKLARIKAASERIIERISKAR